MFSGFIPNFLEIEALLNEPGGPVWLELEKIGKEAVTIAQRNAPVGSLAQDVPGELRDSIRFVMEPAHPIAVSIGSDVPYAAYVEFGTSDMGAQPFLRPALMSVQP